MSDIEQLERETEQTRSQIADTLDELRASMTPGRVLDQLADRMSQGAPAAFARNLKDQTVNNPLSVALIGAGLAWLMLSPKGSSTGFWRRSGANDGTDDASGALGTIRDTAGSMSDAAQESATQTAETVGETAGSIGASTRQTADQAAEALRSRAGAISDSIQRSATAGYATMADTARRTADTLSESTNAARQRTMQSGSAFLDFCRNQPMVLAGLGLAVGAVMGALLPASETEDELMGEASDRAKDNAQDFASEQVEKAKKVGERALDAAKDAAVKPSTEQETTGASTQENEKPTEAKPETPTLVPSDESELERRGQPWTSDNAPI